MTSHHTSAARPGRAGLLAGLLAAAAGEITASATGPRSRSPPRATQLGRWRGWARPWPMPLPLTAPPSRGTSTPCWWPLQARKQCGATTVRSWPPRRAPGLFSRPEDFWPSLPSRSRVARRIAVRRPARASRSAQRPRRGQVRRADEAGPPDQAAGGDVPGSGVAGRRTWARRRSAGARGHRPVRSCASPPGTDRSRPDHPPRRGPDLPLVTDGRRPADGLEAVTSTVLEEAGVLRGRGQPATRGHLRDSTQVAPIVGVQ